MDNDAVALICWLIYNLAVLALAGFVFWITGSWWSLAVLILGFASLKVKPKKDKNTESTK